MSQQSTKFIQNSAITLAKMANLAANSVIGNSTGSSATPTALTLASTNTVSSIVFRDSSGNFSAGTITATLSGTATNITATSNSTLTTLSALSLPGSQVSGNISGNAANITGTLAIANGGTNNASLAVTAGGVIYSDGTKLVNVGAGIANQVLQSNGSSAPTWVTNTPSGQASLAIVAKTADYTATTSDNLVEYDISGASRTLTLFAASGNTGKFIKVKLVTVASTNTLTVTDGSFSMKMATVNEELEIYSNGTNWKVLSHYIPEVQSTTTTTWTANGGGGTSPGKGTTVVNDKITWWREGAYMVGTIDYSQSAAGTAGTAGQYYTLTVPGGWSIDTTNIVLMSSPTTGNGFMTTVGDGVFGNDTNALTTTFPMNVHVYDSTHFCFRFQKDANSRSTIGASATPAFNSTQLYFALRFKVPITNWTM